MENWAFEEAVVKRSGPLPISNFALFCPIPSYNYCMIHKVAQSFTVVHMENTAIINKQYKKKLSHILKTVNLLWSTLCNYFNELNTVSFPDNFEKLLE